MAIRNMALELYQARNAELEAERLRAFREVARRVAHEMKNPLTPVRLAVRQLHQTATEEQQESLEVLIAESARLEQLAREFAGLGRLPEGPSAEVDLAELLGEILKTSLPQTMTWRLDAEPGPSSVVGHYDPLRRALGNLVRNAVEATDGRGLLEARVVREGDEVIVSLADHGPGIPEEKRSRIFEPYYTGKADGTGLGLAIVKQVIDHHHGNIVLRETPGGGATFEIRLPAAPEEDPT
jgi:signal transduction histidine kinase